MDAMQNLTQATIEHIEKFFSSHGISATVEPSPWGWTLFAVHPETRESLMIISWADQWPKLDVSVSGPDHTPLRVAELDISDDDLDVLLGLYAKLPRFSTKD